jgi:ElaB/YqjD/DUF883 family membrane-anchored ribosome-binding protein
MFDATHSKELFGQATRAFETAIQSGIKLQEESVKFLTEMFNEVNSPEKWQKTVQSMMNGVVDSSRKSMEEAVQVMNENAQTSLELLQQACQTPPADIEEAKSRTMTLWETTLRTVRRNTEAVLRANSRLVDAWTESAEKLNGKNLERMAKMAQRATQEAREAVQRAVQEATTVKSGT